MAHATPGCSRCQGRTRDSSLSQRKALFLASLPMTNGSRSVVSNRNGPTQRYPFPCEEDLAGSPRGCHRAQPLRGSHPRLPVSPRRHRARRRRCRARSPAKGLPRAPAPRGARHFAMRDLRLLRGSHVLAKMPAPSCRAESRRRVPHPNRPRGRQGSASNGRETVFARICSGSV